MLLHVFSNLYKPFSIQHCRLWSHPNKTRIIKRYNRIDSRWDFIRNPTSPRCGFVIGITSCLGRHVCDGSSSVFRMLWFISDNILCCFPSMAFVLPRQNHHQHKYHHHYRSLLHYYCHFCNQDLLFLVTKKKICYFSFLLVCFWFQTPWKFILGRDYSFLSLDRRLLIGTWLLHVYVATEEAVMLETNVSCICHMLTCS